jgi:hypothetical protein
MEVVQSVIGWMPGFDRVYTFTLPESTGKLKWRSHGTLHIPGQTEKTGWVIHELVKF